MKSIGGPNDPSERQECELDQCTDIGYACGHDVTVEGFYAQRKLSCGGSVEQNYYNPSIGTKGAIIVTNTVCSVYYLEENIVDKVELLTRPEIVRGDPLLL